MDEKTVFTTQRTATGTSDPCRAIALQVSSGRWITLDLATQEWRWMFYREKYYCEVAQESLWAT